MPTASTTGGARERQLLAAARDGDERAFAELIEPLPGRAARALLPDARLGPRRRGRAPGRAAAGLARPGPVRGAQLAALVAVHDRHQHLPERDRAAPQARAADRLRPGHRSARRAGRADRRVGLGRALSGRDRSASRMASPRPRPATSSARASSWRSSPRCSTCPPTSARC